MAKKRATKKATKKASKPRNRAAQDTTLINHRALTTKIESVAERYLDMARAVNSIGSKLIAAERLAKTFDDRLRSAVVRLDSVETNMGRLVRAEASKSAGNLIDKKTPAPRRFSGLEIVAPPQEPDDKLAGALDTPTTPLNLAEQARDHGDNG